MRVIGVSSILHKVEERQAVETILLKRQRKIVAKIELYPACQWKHNYLPGKQNVYPRPPCRVVNYWDLRFRLRVNGRWYNPDRKREKYIFYTRQEIVNEILRLM